MDRSGPLRDVGKRIPVVGSGPAGLSAAYHPRLLGHEVTLREAQEQPGGMIRYGIPRYRLPREVLDAEMARIVALAVTLELNTRVDGVLAAQRDGGFDAVFLAVGAGTGRRTNIPAGDSARILDAVALLAGMEGEDPPLLGRRVAVCGGGNTAMDAARKARRLGATDAVVVYRRARDRMPPHDVEVAEAMEEGVRTKWLSTIKHADEGHLTIERMQLDQNGFPQPTGGYSVCPGNAITKLGPGKRFAIDLDYGKGCGLRAAECPSAAIGMVPEE